MNKPHLALVLSLMSVVSVPAFAQTPPTAAPPANPPGAQPAMPADMPPPPSDPGAVPETQPPPPLDAVPPPPVAPTIEDRVTTVEGKVEGLDEAMAETKSTTSSLSKLKFSGYIQGRYEYRADSVNGLRADGRPATTNQFLVRRGRLKATYAGTNSEYILQVDATPAGVALRDAEATFVDTWSPLGLRLTVGQFKWSFGYEVLQSSGEREMPERSLVIRRLFPGERDRGLRIQGKYEWLRFAAGLVNGVRETPTALPAQEAIFGGSDQNSFKDVVARVGGDFEWVVIGLSGYWGRPLISTPGSTTSVITGTDTNMDGAFTPNELTVTSTVGAPSYRRFSRGRIGADVQLYFDVPMLGGLALKGEFILAKDTSLDYGAVAADPCLNVTSMGWIATLVQNVGDYVGAVVRVDYYDPNRSKSLADTCVVTDSRTMTTMKRGLGDATTTVGGGLLLHGSGNIKGTFVYEHIVEQSTTVKNDIFTAQLQAKF